MRKSITTYLTCTALVAQAFCAVSLHAQTGNAYAMDVKYAQRNPVSANSYKQDTQKQTLINVLKELNKSKGIYFLFSEKGIDQTMVNPIPDNIQNTEKILQQVFVPAYIGAVMVMKAALAVFFTGMGIHAGSIGVDAAHVLCGIKP